MDAQSYINKMKRIQNDLLDFIDGMEDNLNDQTIIIKTVNDSKALENRYEFKSFLYLILKIATNHCFASKFFNKISNILIYFKDPIKQSFSNIEIFDIFESNRKLLLLLIKNEIIIIDDTIYSKITSRINKNRLYHKYFYPEIKSFLSESTSNSILSELPENFEEKREIGENDSKICELIRNDLHKEFIIYVNQTNYPLNSHIKLSIFETNDFILKNKGETTLIEYAAFFGSIGIFNFLAMKNVQMSPSLIRYAIHGGNVEIIRRLEEEKICSNEEYYKIGLKESIKCHHNEIADYFLNNFGNENDDQNAIENNFKENMIYYCLHYYNFEYFPQEFNRKFDLFYACKFDFFIIVENLLKNKDLNLNEKFAFQVLI